MKKIIHGLLKVRPRLYLENAVIAPLTFFCLVAAAFLAADHLLLLFRLCLLFSASNLALAIASKIAQFKLSRRR